MNNFLLTYGIGFAVFIVIGLFSKSVKNYYKGSADYGLFTTTSGLLASFIGGGSIINLIGLANKYGYWAYADVIPATLGLIIAFLFITKERSNNFFYKTEYNNPLTLKIHHAVIVLLYSLVMVAQFIGLKKLAVMTGVSNTNLLLLITAALVWAYSFKGYSAVANTDKAQFIIMIFGFYLITLFYFVLPNAVSNTNPIEKEVMPISLVLALSLPLFFLPISQEIHQRASVAGTETVVKRSLLISSVIYLFLGSITVFAGVYASTSGLPGVIAEMPNSIFGSVVFFAVLTALVSTTDTALNISAHSLSEVVRSSKLENKQYFLSILVMVAVIILSNLFPTILSVILLALFLYMSGPAFMSLSKIFALNEKTALAVSVITILIHITVKVVGYQETTLGLLVITIQFLAFGILAKMDK